MPTKPSSPVNGSPVQASSSSAKFRAIRSARAFEEIAAQIRAELEAGRLRIGSRLPSERALSAQFGVSRNTLREALRSLENSGLLTLLKGATGGAFISERSGQAVATGLLDMYHVGTIPPNKLTEARIWLESIIVREACQRATAADIVELNANIDAAEDAARRGEFSLRIEKHLEFHRILARMTGNPLMLIMMNGVLDIFSHFIGKIGDYDNGFVLQSRRRFMKHLQERNDAEAIAEMEASLLRLQKTYLSRMDAGAKGSKPESGVKAPASAKRAAKSARGSATAS